MGSNWTFWKVIENWPTPIFAKFGLGQTWIWPNLVSRAGVLVPGARAAPNTCRPADNKHVLPITSTFSSKAKFDLGDKTKKEKKKGQST